MKKPRPIPGKKINPTPFQRLELDKLLTWGRAIRDTMYGNVSG